MPWYPQTRHFLYLCAIPSCKLPLIVKVLPLSPLTLVTLSQSKCWPKTFQCLYLSNSYRLPPLFLWRKVRPLSPLPSSSFFSSLYTNSTPAAPAIAPAKPIFLRPLTGTAAPVASTRPEAPVALSVLLPPLRVPVTLCELASKLAVLEPTAL